MTRSSDGDAALRLPRLDAFASFWHDACAGLEERSGGGDAAHWLPTGGNHNPAPKCYAAFSAAARRQSSRPFLAVAARLCSRANRDSTYYEVYVMNADGSQVVRLTYNDSTDAWPMRSPDDPKIVLDSDRDDPNG